MQKLPLLFGGELCIIIIRTNDDPWIVFSEISEAHRLYSD